MDKYAVQKKMALFKHHPECSSQCCHGMITALSSDYEITLFNKDEIYPGCFNRFDIVAFPGGIGDANSYDKFFRRRAQNTIAEFVEEGGYYLGICMGAYWAGKHWFDILDGVDTEQYIKRPRADIRRSYGTVAEVEWLGRHEEMFFYDGCALVGDEHKYDVVARYSNRDPMAIIQGRIGLIGCHPESEQSWYEKPYRYIGNKWHRGRHHRLLLEFVNRLVTQKGCLTEISYPFYRT